MSAPFAYRVATDLSPSHASVTCDVCREPITFSRDSLGKPFSVTWPDGSVHRSSGIAGRTVQTCRCGSRPLVRQAPLAPTESRRKHKRPRIELACECGTPYVTWEDSPADACRRCRNSRSWRKCKAKTGQPRMGGDLKCGSAV